MRRRLPALLALLVNLILLANIPSLLPAQRPPTVNYDEANVGPYKLPELLRFANGQPVKSPRDWARRRKEVAQLLEDQMFGHPPQYAGKPTTKLLASGTTLEGTAKWQEQEVCFQDFCFAVLTVVPSKSNAGRVPLFVGLNYKGNQAVLADPKVRLTPKWQRPNTDGTVVANRANEKSRGAEASRWPLQTIIGAGFGLVTACYNEIYPDHKDGEAESIYRVAPFKGSNGTNREASSGQAIAAWAWGLSRMLDLAETNPTLDAKRAVVIGHSRLGKTSLWAGAADTRFAGVIGNDSGEGGAALSRRILGETIADLNKNFPHWFATYYREYSGRADAMPFDQHFLLALAAPRPLYIASAEDDRWADPKGEFLSAWEAGAAYRLLGQKGLELAVPDGQHPKVSQPAHGGQVGYHMRPGPHDITVVDWTEYVKFFAERMKK